jgi:primosomal protein N' (replication factor Y)
MDFFDILFPVNMGSLTYRCPEPFLEIARPGMIVSAPLKNKVMKGIIAGESLKIPEGEIKYVRDVHGNTPVLSTNMLHLLTWMSEYYVAEQGLILKNILPKEAFTKVKQRKARGRFKPASNRCSPGGPVPDVIDTADGLVRSICSSLQKVGYRTFLLHAPTTTYEYSFLTEILDKTKRAIILVPEISTLNNVYPLLSARFGERVSLLHSELSAGMRSESIERIISGQSDIVLGTRSAVFAPLKRVALIAVIEEHSASYKQERSPCYSGRDVAVLRGSIEKATVLLSSICPSVESFFNCKSGKYTLLKPTYRAQRPKLKIIDMRHEKLQKPYLSKAVADASARHLKKGGKIMFVVNRRGHSTLHCTDCGHVEGCPACRIPLVFHKQDMSLRCHYCGYALRKIPESCSKCKGYNLQLYGAGTQRVQEDLEDLFGAKVLRLDSDRARGKSEMESLIGSALTDANRIMVGTKLMTKRLDRMHGFSLSAILNTDILLNIPDFRSGEKAYQEISSVSDLTIPGGEIFIQTRMPGNYIFKSLKNHDYNSFVREELLRRKSLGYPPYSRLLLMKFISARDISPELSENIRRTACGLEILGPYAAKNTRGQNEFKLLMKSSARGKLHEAARALAEAFRNSKDVRIKIDVDPLVI